MAAKEMISLRVWRSDLEAWKAAAKEAGVTRSAWINQTLNKATQKSVSGDSVSAARDEAGFEDGASATRRPGSASIAEVEERFKSYLSGRGSGEPPTL